MCSYHDDQQDILEVIPEAQSGAAEQSEVSFQELQKGAQWINHIHMHTHTYEHNNLSYHYYQLLTLP